VKINWFSPSPPSQCESAVHSAAVLPALAREASITLWVHQPAWPPELAEHAEIRRYQPDDMPWIDINAADVTIYHIANDAELHGPIWQVARQHPGIVVLHDLELQSLFAGLLRTQALSREEWLEMREYHHPGQKNMDEPSKECLLTGGAIENAIGLVLHRAEAYAHLAKCVTMPVAHLPLPAPETLADYIAGLRQLIENVLAAGPREAAYRLATRAGRVMAPWFNPEAAGILLPHVIEAISDLCADREP